MMIPSEYFNKYKEKTREETLSFLETLVKEQVENDSGVYNLSKMLSILFFSDVQYEPVFLESGDFAQVHDVVLSYLQKAPLPYPIKTRDGTLIGGNGIKSEDKSVINFIMSSVESFYGKTFQEILTIQSQSTVEEETISDGTGAAADDALNIAEFGIGKWAGDRLSTFMVWCYNNQFDPYNENVQIIYIAHELLNSADMGLEDIMRSDNFTNAILPFSVLFQLDTEPDRIQEKTDLAAELYTRYYI